MEERGKEDLMVVVVVVGSEGETMEVFYGSTPKQDIPVEQEQEQEQASSLSNEARAAIDTSPVPAVPCLNGGSK